nr:MAG TPA: hypothetical protein [Caudoviricetes sp.]
MIFLNFLQRYVFRPVSQINLYNKDLKITEKPIPKNRCFPKQNRVYRIDRYTLFTDLSMFLFRNGKRRL